MKKFYDLWTLLELSKYFLEKKHASICVCRDRFSGSVSGYHILMIKIGDKSEGSMNRFEPPRGKTNNVVSDKVRHKPACTATEAG